MKKTYMRGDKMLKQYRYRGKTKEGRTVKGRIKHYHQDQIIHHFKEQEIWIFHIKKQHPLWNYLYQILFSPKFSHKELSLFFFQLSSMLSIGITVLDALDTLQSQATSKKTQQGIIEIYVLLQQGHSLSSAMKIQGGFPLFSVHSIEAGEKGGQLEFILKKLGQYYEDLGQILDQLKNALTYPIFVLLTTIGVFVGFIYFLLPLFSELLYSMLDTIPPFTLTLLHIFQFIRQRGWLIIFLFLLLFIFYIFCKKNHQGAKVLGYLSLHLPILGPFMTRWLVIQFAGVLGLLLGSGVPLLLALEQSILVIGNPYVEEKLLEVLQNIQTGSLLSKEMKKHSFFPKSFIQMVALGEQTGDLEGVLNKICHLYEQEINMVFKRAMALLEPTLILVVSCVVGGMLFTVMYPLLQIINTMGEVL